MSFEFDMSNFSKGIQQLKKAIPEAAEHTVNQAALDVSGYALDQIPPIGDGNNVQAERSKIKAFLGMQLSTTVKIAKSGKRKGKWIRAKGRGRELIRANLIANYWRGRLGKKGLYGKDMKRYSGKLRQNRQVSVGFLKSIFIPLIRRLNPLCKFKVPFSKTNRISRWPGSKGSGIAEPAKKGVNPLVTLKLFVNVRNSQDGKVMGVLQRAVQSALDWKGGKMQREAEKAFQAEFDKVNS